MFAQIEYPEKLVTEELDKYLANGWFRMRQSIFTTNFLHFNLQFYSAIWLRVKLDQSIYDKKYLTLRKLNKGFKAEIKKAGTGTITPQHESLYQSYRQSISFEVSPSLNELLFGNEIYNRFNTFEANIYDGDKMVAAGFFDLGKISAAGITCIYHPAYKKFSLGKYLMYLKMDFCKQQQLQYFYPGYVVPGYPAFDYKLEIGKASLQFLQLSTQQWLPYVPFTTTLIPLAEMLEKLTGLQPYLAKNKIPNTIFYYKFFEVNLDPYYLGNKLFDFPVFIYCFPTDDVSFFSLIVYDIRDASYHLLQCSSVINIGILPDVVTIFDTDLLKVERQLFATAIPGEMGAHISGIFENK
ncbi:MAG: hypothetical protein ABI760_16340 [Ferruginibacter sp.]